MTIGFQRLSRDGNWFLSAFLVVWLAGVIIPMLSIVAFAFLKIDADAQTWRLSLDAFREIFLTGRWEVTARTVRICATVTLLLLVVSFPFALWLAKGARSPTLKLLTWTLLTAPFFLSATARTIIWRPVLGLFGPVNTTLIDLGVIKAPLTWLLFSEPAVHFGLIGPYLPNMIWPIFLSIILINDDLLESSKDIGASPWQTLRHVIVPLSLPGIMAGIVFTFIPMLGDDVVPKLLGGQQIVMLGAAMLDIVTALNYTVAAAMSALILAVVIILQALAVWVMKRVGGSAPILEGLN